MITLVSVLYAGFIAVWQALRLSAIGEWWLFELLDIFGLLLFTPLPFLFLIALPGRARTALVALLVPLGVLMWDYGALLLPQRVGMGGVALRVMTANLLASNAERSRVSMTLTLAEPDVVALQELTPSMAEYLATSLRAQFPHQLLMPSDVPDDLGIGVLSRYPVHMEPETGWYSHVCGCQRVMIEVGGRTVSFVNVHPPPPAIGYIRTRWLTIPVSFDRGAVTNVLDAALDGIDLERVPTVVVGDFNISDRQPTYRRIRAHLFDAYREAGWGLGYTFPSVSFEGFPAVPIVRIDYVMHNAALTARAARTGTMPGSDHRYVVVDLLLR